jgi:hypothetical protein
METMNLKSVLVLIVVGMLFYSCDSDNNDLNGNSILRIKLTDSPGDYKAVYIDVREVRINATDDADSGWVTLENINAGVYDLMKLTNGTDTLLGENEIPAGDITQIRLVLGDQNSVIDGEDSVGMHTPSAQQSGLKLQVNATLEPELAYDILLDFDAAKSVVKAGNSGNYNLKPVIRTIVDQSTGSLKGIVNPDSIQSAVYAILGDDSIGTYSDMDGKFMIKGLDPDTYSLYIDPGTESGIKDSLISDISVELGVVTDVGEVVLEVEVE